MEEEKPEKIKTFKELSDSWIKTTVPATCKPSTVREYQDILHNHILPVFKDEKITLINKGRVKDFLLGKLNDGFAHSTVGHIRNCISGVFNLAMDHEMIKVNPAQQLRGIIKKKDSRKEMNPLSGNELNKLLSVIEENYPDYYTLTLLLASTGLRIGEALALKWEDIDFKRKHFKLMLFNFLKGCFLF